ncbi:hypothetical protein [Clostridium ihumii]|uniref:hypothetical protein n=1 Tax=Clostridium ihumii TaxID=1470356 RepID=UPI00058D0432|nr:hypothetical protein [Clostridium ihumii]
MIKMYSSYKCVNCKNEFVLLLEDVEKFKGYLTCPYCNSKKVKKLKEADDLKECMYERTYKKINGAIRQVR